MPGPTLSAGLRNCGPILLLGLASYLHPAVSRWHAALSFRPALILFHGLEPQDGAALEKKKKKTSKGMWADAIAQIYETAEIINRTIKANRAEWEEAEAV